MAQGNGLDAFLAWWSTRVRDGEVSGMDGVEILSLRIFYKWLEDNGYINMDTGGVNVEQSEKNGRQKEMYSSEIISKMEKKIEELEEELTKARDDIKHWTGEVSNLLKANYDLANQLNAAKKGSEDNKARADELNEVVETQRKMLAFRARDHEALISMVSGLQKQLTESDSFKELERSKEDEQYWRNGYHQLQEYLWSHTKRLVSVLGPGSGPFLDDAIKAARALREELDNTKKELEQTKEKLATSRERLYSLTCKSCGDRLRSHYCPTCGKKMSSTMPEESADGQDTR